MSKFELFKTAESCYYFRLKAANHEIILVSESYTRKENCLKGIEAVRSNALLDERYQRLTAMDGSPYFNLSAANGEIIGSSEMYASVQAREKGIDAVKREGPRAEVFDFN